MSPSLKLLCLIGLPILASCAAANDRESIHYKISAEPATRTTEIACEPASVGGCVFRVGDSTAGSSRTIRLVAGATQRLGPDQFEARYCAGVHEERMAWPGCLGDTTTAGPLNRSTAVDFVYW